MWGRRRREAEADATGELLRHVSLHAHTAGCMCWSLRARTTAREEGEGVHQPDRGRKTTAVAVTPKGAQSRRCGEVGVAAARELGVATLGKLEVATAGMLGVDAALPHLIPPDPWVNTWEAVSAWYASEGGRGRGVAAGSRSERTSLSHPPLRKLAQSAREDEIDET
jgi:hypothetical protein